MDADEMVGRCVGCGLLAKYPGTEKTSYRVPFYEVTHYERESSVLLGSWQDGVGARKSVPACFAGIPFVTANPDLEYGPGASSKFEEEINQDKKCGSWVKHHLHLDPKWHWDFDQMQRLEANRREWELKLEEQNNRFLGGLEEQRREWEKDSGKWPNRLIWAAAILAGAQVGAALLALPAMTRWLGLD